MSGLPGPPFLYARGTLEPAGRPDRLHVLGQYDFSTPAVRWRPVGRHDRLHVLGQYYFSTPAVRWRPVGQHDRLHVLGQYDCSTPAVRWRPVGRHDRLHVLGQYYFVRQQYLGGPLSDTTVCAYSDSTILYTSSTVWRPVGRRPVHG